MFRGESVSIGPLLPGDNSAMFRWFNDVEAARLDLAFRPTDWSGFKSWSDSLARDTSRVVFAIRRLDSPAIIGFSGLSNINPVHRSADLAVRIGEEPDRGHGYGRDALRLTLAFGWNHLNLHRVALTTLAHNGRAIRSFTAAGFEREGVARSAAYIDGQWHDVMIMGILRPMQD